MTQFTEGERKYKTKNGELVYSQGEMVIADYLYDHNIPYEYESYRVIENQKYLPDFYLPIQDVFIEFQGMVSDKNSRKRYFDKSIAFKNYGLYVLYIYPNHIKNIDEYLNAKYHKITGRSLLHPLSGKRESDIAKLKQELVRVPIPDICDFTDCQIESLTKLHGNSNVFLSGEAGTGKSFLISQFLKDKDPKEYRIIASTGTAAIKLGGCTFHSFFGLGILQGGEDATIIRALKNKKLINRLHATKCIVIDEVSMLTGAILSAAERLSREVRRDNRPWGGLRVIAVGDFAQLPPVTTGKKKKDWAFLSEVWKRTNFHNAILTTVVRTKDSKYLQMLQSIRSGKLSSEVIQYFEGKVIKDSTDFVGTRLFALKERVNTFNSQKLNELDTELFESNTVYEGNKGYIEILKRTAPIPDVLQVKEGALVMIRVNDVANMDSGMDYANGSLGYVHSITDHSLAIDLLTGKRVYLTKTRFTAVDANGDVKAWAYNFPVMLGWASTIHKAQGATLDRVLVQADNLWEPGQAYVALSRTRTGDNLFLTSWSSSSVILEPLVTNFYKQLV